MSSRRGTAFATARRLAWEAVSALPTEEVALSDAVGRTLARDVVALTDVPHYASSAMDGWAVTGAPPWRIVEGPSVGAGEATPIVTGGLVPIGADAVLRSEHGDVDDGVLAPSVVPAVGRHIRRAGEEACRGDVLISSGTTLNPAQVAVAAAGGTDRLTVRRRPSVAFVFTGTEVVTSGPPSPGRVRDSFDPMLPSALDALGARTVSRVRIGDDSGALTDSIYADADLVITTGGTGDSPVDHLRTALAARDARWIVDGLAVRPGAPTLLARIPDGPLVLGLPGNPLAAVIGLLTLAPPVIAGLLGIPLPPLHTVQLGEDAPGTVGRMSLQPYRRVDGAAIRCSRTGSGMLRGLAEAEGILVVPETGAAVGDRVASIRLPW